jgi:hypothetical protein
LFVEADVEDLLRKFVEKLPLERLIHCYSKHEFENFRRVALDPRTISLSQIMCHYFYWVCLAPWVQNALSVDLMEQMIVGLQRAYFPIDRGLRKTPFYSLFSLPLLLDALLSTAMNMFRQSYPAW